MKKIGLVFALLTIFNSVVYAGTLEIGTGSAQCDSGPACSNLSIDTRCEGQIAGIIISQPEVEQMAIVAPNTGYTLTGSVTTINNEVGGDSTIQCTLLSDAMVFFLQNSIPNSTKSVVTPPGRATPATPGTYTVDVKHLYEASQQGAETTDYFSGSNAASVSYTVSNPTTQCNDGVNNNDGDNLVDANDPQCHTDCNVNNLATYLASHNSEAVAPNGIVCQAATLQLNGRAAFLQVVKNFFASITARAFAGE